MSTVILKDLCALIRKSTIHFRENCPHGDFVLCDEFKEKHKRFLVDKGSMVDFYNYSAALYTSVGNAIYLPNQWFIIAAYAVGVYQELMIYKKYLMAVCMDMGQKPKTFIPKLRDETASINRCSFFESCYRVFTGHEKSDVELAATRLWRFATDYSWWSGNKTVDRTDFHFSVILNMLGLVNASQSYVAEIVSDYTFAGLNSLVSELSNFVEGQSGPTYLIEDYHNPADTPVDSCASVESANAETTNDEDDFFIRVNTKK